MLNGGGIIEMPHLRRLVRK